MKTLSQKQGQKRGTGQKQGTGQGMGQKRGRTKLG